MTDAICIFTVLKNVSKWSIRRMVERSHALVSQTHHVLVVHLLQQGRDARCGHEPSTTGDALADVPNGRTVLVGNFGRLRPEDLLEMFLPVLLLLPCLKNFMSIIFNPHEIRNSSWLDPFIPTSHARDERKKHLDAIWDQNLACCVASECFIHCAMASWVFWLLPKLFLSRMMKCFQEIQIIFSQSNLWTN